MPDPKRMLPRERTSGEPPPIVTATRPSGRGRVEIELDGRPWRVVPLTAAARAGLANGIPLDRERARALNRALRAHRALQTATRLLRYADHSTATLEQRLVERRVGAIERRSVVETLRAARVIDDERYASGRAASMAGRGYGDAAIRSDLSARGLDDALVNEALSRLEPEHVRVGRIVERRGATVGTLAHLSRKGFGEEALESIVASIEANGLG